MQESPFHDSLTEPNHKAIRIGGIRIERFTIPLVYEGRYFLVEPPEGLDMWTIFQFRNGAPLIDCLHSQPWDGRCQVLEDGTIISSENIGDRPLYRIERDSAESRIHVPNGTGFSHLTIDNGRILFGGSDSGTYYEDGDIPIGMYLEADGAMQFRRPTAPEFKALLAE